MEMLRQLSHKIISRGYHEMMLRGYLRKIWYPRYQFQYFSRQLCYLANCIERTSKVEGAIVEIGCAHGLTTTFLYEYMVDSEETKEYYCIDTFSGFTPDDISVEKKVRGKDHDYGKEFKNNNAEWF